MASSDVNILTGMFHVGKNESKTILPITQSINAVGVTLNFLFGLPWHIYVAWLIISGTRKVLTSDFFVLNLAICETLFILGSPVYPCDDIAVLAPMHLFTTFLFTCRPLFQTCICVERYLAVLHPLLFLKYKPLRYRLVITSLCWLFVLSASISCVFLHLVTKMLIVFFTNVLLFMVMTFCCMAVLRALVQPGPGDGRREIDGANHAKMQAFKIILVLLSSLILNIIIAIAGVAFFFSRINIEVPIYSYTLSLLVMMLTGVTQPLLYLHSKKKLSCKYDWAKCSSATCCIKL